MHASKLFAANNVGFTNETKDIGMVLPYHLFMPTWVCVLCLVKSLLGYLAIIYYIGYIVLHFVRTLSPIK